MKHFLAYIWKRRWCRLLLAGTVLCGLPLFHPLVRQSLFGPKIDGIPWCMWESEVRIEADPQRQENLFFKVMRKLGLVHVRHLGLPPRTAEGLPLYLQLTKDRDAGVRRVALQQLEWMSPEYDSDILPTLRQSLQDADPECRLLAAAGVWRTSKDVEMKAIALPLLDHADPKIRIAAIRGLSAMGGDTPELFEPLSKMMDESDWRVRVAVVSSMAYFGKRGLPVLQRGLGDPSNHVRIYSAITTANLGKNAEELIPILVTLQNDSDSSFRDFVSNALHEIDPKRFAKPARKD
jgi:HEAT repeat protein